MRLFAKHLLKPSSLQVITVIALRHRRGISSSSLITETVFGRTGIPELEQQFDEHAETRTANGRIAAAVVVAR